MSQIVHVQTQISVTFGVLDGEGNAMPQQPIVATLGKFSAEAFAEAFEGIKAERDKLAANLNGQQQAEAEADQAKRAARRPKR